MTVTFEYATHADLPTIVHIYNEIIPSRLATADLEPISVASREDWFTEFDPNSRPLWVMKDGDQIAGWVSLESFYGRPAYTKRLKSASTLMKHFAIRDWGNRR